MKTKIITVSKHLTNQQIRRMFEAAGNKFGWKQEIIIIGAVIANAIYDAVCVRVFQLPMTSERVKAAIEKS